MIVDIAEALLSIPSLFKFRPTPAANVVFPLALMSNTIQTRSFKPHDARLGDWGSDRFQYQMGVFICRSCSEVQVWPQNGDAKTAHNQQQGENSTLIHESIVEGEEMAQKLCKSRTERRRVVFPDFLVRRMESIS